MSCCRRRYHESMIQVYHLSMSSSHFSFSFAVLAFGPFVFLSVLEEEKFWSSGAGGNWEEGDGGCGVYRVYHTAQML